MIDSMENPEFVKALMGFITTERNRWHDTYCKHFNVPLRFANIGDDWINIPFITPEFFREFVLPCYKEIAKHHGGIEYVYSCGNQTLVQKYLLELEGLDILEISPWTDLEQSLLNIPPEKNLSLGFYPETYYIRRRRPWKNSFETSLSVQKAEKFKYVRLD